MKRSRCCLLRRNFFAQNVSGKQSDIDDEIYYLVKYAGFSAEYVESLEIDRRMYFVRKLSEDIQRENDEIKKSSKK